jgi:hypothetical protein
MIPSGLEDPSLIQKRPFDYTKLPFFATLNLSHLSGLTNNPIKNQPMWMIIPTKLQLDIAKFDGKPIEYPSTHAMNYHLWFYLAHW